MKQAIVLAPSFLIVFTQTILLASNKPPRRGPKNPSSARYCVRSTPVEAETSCESLYNLFQECQKDDSKCVELVDALKKSDGACIKKEEDSKE